LEEKKKSELFLSAASPSNLEPKESIKGAGKTILGDPGAKKHHFDDSLIELKGPHQEEIQKQKEFISKTMDIVKDFEEKGAKPKICGDKVDENASVRAEAMAFVWSPLACIGG
jgi:hypothetical protein